MLISVYFNIQRRSGRFYPTRLAINLASGLKEVNLDVNKTGYIVVETNYRVYAYTGELSSNLLCNRHDDFACYSNYLRYFFFNSSTLGTLIAHKSDIVLGTAGMFC